MVHNISTLYFQKDGTYYFLVNLNFLLWSQCTQELGTEVEESLFSLEERFDIQAAKK